jgi:hypothetical protein
MLGASAPTHVLRGIGYWYAPRSISNFVAVILVIITYAGGESMHVPRSQMALAAPMAPYTTVQHDTLARKALARIDHWLKYVCYLASCIIAHTS